MIMSSLPREKAGSGSAVNNTARALTCSPSASVTASWSGRSTPTRWSSPDSSSPRACGAFILPATLAIVWARGLTVAVVSAWRRQLKP